MSRSDRLFRIVQIMRSRRFVTAEYLAETLEVSTRTIYRDMRDGTTVYVDHITAVKAEHPRVDIVDPADRDRILTSE